MRAVIQRVSEAEVLVAGETVGHIGHGLLVLLGVGHGDSQAEVEWMAKKLTSLRIFPDDAGKFDRSVTDVGGAMLVVSQFTLFGDARKGNRPSFINAADPEIAQPLYEAFCDQVATLGIPVQTGIFAASMDVRLRNDGPVTLVIDRDPSGETGTDPAA